MTRSTELNEPDASPPSSSSSVAVKRSGNGSPVRPTPRSARFWYFVKWDVESAIAMLQNANRIATANGNEGKRTI